MTPKTNITAEVSMTTQAAKRAAELVNAETTSCKFTEVNFTDPKYPVAIALVKLVQHISDVAKRVEDLGFPAGCNKTLIADIRKLILRDNMDILAVALKQADAQSSSDDREYIAMAEYLRRELASYGFRIVPIQE